MSQHFFNKKLQRRIEEKTKNLEPRMYYGNFDLYAIKTTIQKALQEEGYANNDINCELEIWFFNKENILKIIRERFPPDIQSTGGYAYGVLELLCIIHGISTKFKKYLLDEEETILVFMEKSRETIERALDNGELPYEYTESNSRENNIRIKLIDVVNWRKKKLSIYPDFCVPFDEKSEEMIIKEANIKTYDQLAKENNLLRNDINLLKEKAAELESEQNVNKKNLIQALVAQMKEDASAAEIDVDMPLAIEAIAHFFGIRVLKGDMVYNLDGEEVEGYSYDTIKNHIKERGFFASGKQGNANKKKKYDRNEKLKELMNILSDAKYRKFLEYFNQIR